MHLLTSQDINKQSDSDSSSNSSEPESRTRVGDDYQANTTVDLKYPQNSSFETLIWKPSDRLTDSEMEEYLFFSRAKYGYNIDQALAMLFWHNHNIQKSLTDMNSFVPLPDEWSYEDKILFEQAFLYHGKRFDKIKTVLPDKTQASLVNYYYMWKKTRNHKSAMDQIQNKNDQDEKEKDDDADYGTVNVTNICCNCDEITQPLDLQSTPKGMLCNLCYNYWKRTGVMRPEHVNNYAVSNKTINNKHYNGVSGGNGTHEIGAVGYLSNHKETKNYLKKFRKPPKGIYLNYEELISLTEPNKNEIFESLENKILSLKREVQSNKQENSILTSKFIDTDKLLPNLDTIYVKKTNNVLTTPVWTQREAELAIQGLQKYGQNFAAIAEIIETKNQESVRAFYDYHKQYTNLDDIITSNSDNINELSNKASVLIKSTKSKNIENQNNSMLNDDDSSSDDVIIL